MVSCAVISARPAIVHLRRLAVFPLVLGLALLVLGLALGSARLAFSAEVLPLPAGIESLLLSRCVDCHNATDYKGELDLTSAQAIFQRSEPVIVRGDAEASRAWQLVAADEMPPEHPLSPTEKEQLRAWIAGGAPWSDDTPLDPWSRTTHRRAGRDWWSWQPLQRPPLPRLPDATWCQSPIDYFVLAALQAKGLTPAPPVDRRTLIRRLYFDLLGLPPEPAAIEQFLQARHPDAYEQLVDRLLASPHYGERWARHWLDLARYTESQGFEYDRFRAHAWHYRDYVIQSLNQDKPYAQFVQEQLAGDVLHFTPTTNEPISAGMVATSFLVCGPWDQAGNAQANVTQRKITREEELEDLIAAVSQTFLGLTVNCARCHSHKFDPITQQDYTRLKAAFAGVRHGERSILSRAEQQAREAEVARLQGEFRESENLLEQLRTVARMRLTSGKGAQGAPAALAPAPLARWTFESDAQDTLGNLHGELVGGSTLRQGRLVLHGAGQYLQTAPLAKPLGPKTLEAWVALATLDQSGGGVCSVQTGDGGVFDAIVYAEREPGKWLAGSNGFARTHDLAAPAEVSGADQLVHVAITYQADGTIACYRNGEPYGAPYQAGPLHQFAAGESQVVMGWRHRGAGQGFLQGEIETAALYDRPLTPREVANSYAAGPAGGPAYREAQLMAALRPEEQQQFQHLAAHLPHLRDRIAQQTAPVVSYVGLREQPAPVHRLQRGDVNSPAEMIAPGVLPLTGLPAETYELPPDAAEEQRRVAVANWLVDRRHPLTARVMANRLWHYHFGRGIVETTNDFGFNGARPSHPELLNWLAVEFRDGGPAWSLKRMHKLIVMSATYQQDSTWRPAAAAVDSDNALLWRFTPRRLEAEIVRDTMLAVSQQLQPQMGGPSFFPFIVTNFNSDFYEPIDPPEPPFQRRTIYRAHVNSGKSPFLEVLDCPDPSLKTPNRRTTTTPLTALALMNNSFVMRQADALAQRIEHEAGDRPAQQVAHAFRLGWGREGTEQECLDATQFVTQQGLREFCWALLNTTEFLYLR